MRGLCAALRGRGPSERVRESILFSVITSLLESENVLPVILHTDNDLAVFLGFSHQRIEERT